jgi:hypothetical protein
MTLSFSLSLLLSEKNVLCQCSRVGKMIGPFEKEISCPINCLQVLERYLKVKYTANM